MTDELLLQHVRTLREEGHRPRVHGNGFIQVDLVGNGSRLHVWDDDVPRQIVNTSKHDHAFGFTSRVVHGTLVNVRYNLVPDNEGEYEVYVPQRREDTEDTKLASTGERVDVEAIEVATYAAGDSYSFEPLIFHDTYHIGPTATVMHKTVRLDVEPRILVPAGQTPDNEFDRDAFDPDMLWDIVERTLS